MLLSTFQHILAQLPALCEKYKIPVHRLEDAHLYQKDWVGSYVHVGEVHMGEMHRFTFDTQAKLLKVEKAYWPHDGTISYTKVD